MVSIVTDYKVLAGRDHLAFNINVLDHMKDGWQPLGGVATAYIPFGAIFHWSQAMVKYDHSQDDHVAASVDEIQMLLRQNG